MNIDIKKLEIELQENHDHHTALLQTILETVDHIVEENKQQGEDIARNTKAIKMMEVDMDQLRRILDKQEKSVENAAESGALNAVKNTLPKAVKKGIDSMIEPARKEYNIKAKKRWFQFWR